MMKYLTTILLLLTVQLGLANAPCSEENLTNNFETGITGFLAADITIAADTDMSLSSLQFNLWTDFTSVTVDAADIIIYTDNGGLPGSEIASFTGLIPDSDVEVMFPVGPFGLSAREVKFTIPSTELTGQTGSTTTFWVSISNIVTSTGTPAYVEINTTSIMGNEAASSSDGGATWSTSSGNEFVYTFDGECTPIGTPPNCIEENLTNNFETGITGFLAADITIAADTDMSLSSLQFNLWTDFTSVTVDAADIIIYTDNGGLPGSEIASFTGLIPDSDVEVMFPVGPFGLSAREVKFTIPSTELTGQTGSTTTYWVSISNIVTSTGTPAYVEINTTSIIGNEAASSSDGGATWSTSSGNEFVYTFGGGCTPIEVEPGCFEENLSNSFENALPSSSNGLFPDQIVATDLTIPADTDMSLTLINANLWVEYQSTGQTGGSILDADITIYSDASGLPGSVIATYTDLIPSSQTLLGTQFGFIEVFDVDFEIPATDLSGQVGEDTTYWVSIFFTTDGIDAVNGNWEVTTASSQGNPIAFSPDLGNSWQISSSFDGVYNFGGECTPIEVEPGCFEENLSNSFENALPSSSNGLFPDQIVATDLTIPADTDMSLTLINANLWVEYQSTGQTGGSILDADITIYSDASGLPGSVIATYTDLIPSSQTLLGTQFGFMEVFDVDFEIPATDLSGQVGEDTTYWVSIFFTTDGVDAVNGNWEVTTASSQGNPIAFSPDLGNSWQISSSFDGVYNFGGECTPIEVEPGCFEENLSNSFENALPSSSNGLFPDQIVATDLTIPADTDMSLTLINANLWVEYQSTGQTGGSILDADITIYSDASGLPGSVIATYTDLIPSSQTLLGTQFGFMEVFDVDFEIPATDLSGQVGEDTTYWVSIFFTTDGIDAVNGNWEVTTASSQGNPIAFSPDLGNSWQISSSFDGVYNFGGECTPIILGTEDNLFEGFKFYPNPAKEKVYIESTNNNQIEYLIVYNLLGQKIIRKTVNDTFSELNISSLSSGTYIIKLVGESNLISTSLKLIKL
ncbi:T9SS type A sorting domain-containing protein [Rasiella rasia]|uniref:T9SS type A sorting domain-containing protein n=1 Tax=Rasiella rasia TaxID=2744027 RepID=A0A6G6GJV0_9FLAO|nr:T9SS type A sorting domain-containing protein [Rasiella rasia]QIE58794.1 T9SS type A sorting domain-containing protein [Rasiella rasia]